MANLEVNGVFPSYPEWEALYHSVLLESDYAKVPTKIFDAETAMFKRTLQLSYGMGVKSHDAPAEMAAINAAISRLVVLRRDLQRCLITTKHE